MYTVGIVDDERTTREYLSALVDWESLGMEVVFTAKDGIDALRNFENKNVDILITDVRMPRMNGVELATNIRAKKPECKILFLSGYTDKEYLKSAISLKVEQYIEKPIDIAELTDVLHAIRKQIEEQGGTRRIPSLISSTLVNASRLIKQEICKELLQLSHGGYHHVHLRYYPLYFDWQEQGLYRVCCIHAHHAQSITQELFSCMEPSLTGESQFDFMTADFGDNDTALIVREDPFLNFDELERILHSHFGHDVSIGISRPVHTTRHLPMAWAEARTYCSLWFYLRKGAVVDEHRAPPLSPLPDHLSTHIPKGYAETQRWLDSFSEYPTEDVNAVRATLHQFYQTMVNAMSDDRVLSLEEFKEKTLLDIRELILNGVYCSSFLKDRNYDPKVNEAILYIFWNYHDTNLSLRVLADHTGLSHNYLCTLFKQNTGTTLNNLITDVRLRRAQRLLETTDYRLYEIAQEVGFTDPNYLSTTFKARFDLTPSQYREQSKKKKL